MAPSRRSSLPALLALALLAGCSHDEKRQAASPGPAPITAPAQQAPRIAAIRLSPGKPRVALVTVKDDGSELRVLVDASAGGLQGLASPAWSPDAERLYFVGVLGERDGDRFVYYESDVFVVDAGGGEPRRITTSGDIQAVAPSPDAKTLVVSRDEHPGKRPPTSGLWLLDAEGRHARRLVRAEAGRVDFGPSWSPDGRRIAFSRCPYVQPDARGFIENTCSVYTLSPDGTRLRELARRSSQAVFSPDGGTIAFVSDRDEHGKLARGEDEEAFANELYVMNADGGDQRRLTESESVDESTPAWSPDGSRIAFTREGPVRFSKQLMLAKADGSCPTTLIGNASDARIQAPWFLWPSWRPGQVTGDLAPLACR